MLLTVRKNSDFYAKIDLTDLDDNKIILDDGDELVFSVKKFFGCDAQILANIEENSHRGQINAVFDVVDISGTLP